MGISPVEFLFDGLVQAMFGEISGLVDLEEDLLRHLERLMAKRLREMNNPKNHTAILLMKESKCSSRLTMMVELRVCQPNGG